MTLFRGYQPAVRCTGGPQGGTKALMSWYLGAYGPRGGTNLGIYNCRNVRGGKTTSLHGEGRAGDLGVNPHGASWGWDVANGLQLHSDELGIQCIIYARKIWSGSYPEDGWRNYAGKADHFDHLHVELGWVAARTLSVARINDVLGAVTTRMLPAPPPPAATSLSGRLLIKGMRGPDIEKLQRILTTNYPLYSAFAVTGYFDDQTEASVREFQKRSQLVVDGKVGPATRVALGW